MHFVVHQMMQLQHVHITHRNRSIERLAGSAIIQVSPAFPESQARSGKLQHILDFMLGCPVKHGRRERHTVLEIFRKIQYFSIAEAT